MPKDDLKHPLQVGFSFGSTSGVITTLGLIAGLYSGTQSRATLIAGILTIAIADSLSDALGIHISEEAESVHTPAEIWTATLATFITKLLISSSFLLPVIFLQLNIAVPLSIAWGVLLLSVFSYYLAKSQDRKPAPIIIEHLSVAALVIILTSIAGNAIHSFWIENG